MEFVLKSGKNRHVIKFLTEEIRTQFHLLPVEVQSNFQSDAEYFAARGMTLQILFADAETLEVSVRIDKELNVS